MLNVKYRAKKRVLDAKISCIRQIFDYDRYTFASGGRESGTGEYTIILLFE